MKQLRMIWPLMLLMLVISSTLSSCGFISSVFESASTLLKNWITEKIQVGVKLPRLAARGRSLQSESAGTTEDLEFLNLVKLSTLSKEERMATLEKIYSYMGTPYLPVGGGCQIKNIERDQNRLYFVLDYCAVGMLLYFIPSQGILTKAGSYVAEAVGGLVTADVHLRTREEDIERPNLFAVVKLAGFGIQVEMNDRYEIYDVDFRLTQTQTQLFAVMAGCKDENRALCDAEQLTHNTLAWANDKLSPEMISDVKSWGTREMLTSLILVVFGPLIDDAVSLRVNHLMVSGKALDITGVDLDVEAIDTDLIDQLKAEYGKLRTLVTDAANQGLSFREIQGGVGQSVAGLNRLANQIQPRGNAGVAQVKQKLLTLVQAFQTVPEPSDQKYRATFDLMLALDGFLSQLRPHEVPSTLREEIYSALEVYKEALQAYLQPVIHSTLVPLKMVEATMAEAEKSMRMALEEGLYNLFRGLAQVIQPLEESTAFFEDDVVVKRTPRGVVRSPNFTWTAEPEPLLLIQASVDQLILSYRRTESVALRIQILTRLAEEHRFQNRSGMIRDQASMDQLSQTFLVFEDALSDRTLPALSNAARRLLRIHGDQAGPLLAYFLRKVRAVGTRMTEKERYLLVVTLETLLDHPSLDLSSDVQAIFETFQGADAFAQRVLSLSFRYLIAKRGQVEALKLLVAKTQLPRSLDECRVYRPLYYLMASDSGTDRVYWYFQALEMKCFAMIP